MDDQQGVKNASCSISGKYICRLTKKARLLHEVRYKGKARLLKAQIIMVNMYKIVENKVYQ